jgi:hypothetical protein
VPIKRRYRGFYRVATLTGFESVKWRFFVPAYSYVIGYP